MRADTPVDFVPNATETYGTNTFFGQRDLGDGNMGIYREANQLPIVRNLTPGVTYHCAVWGYNGSAGPVYTGAPLRFTFTAALTPSESATDLVFSAIEGDRFNVGWDVGNGQRRLLVASAAGPVTALPADGTTYADGDNVFGAGAELAPGQFVVADNDFNGGNQRPTITGLAIGTVYHFALYEFNQDDSGNAFYRRTAPATGSQSTATVPTMTAPGLGEENLNAVSIDFRLPEGNGQRRLLVLKEGSPVDFTPTDLTRYSTNLRFGASEVGTDNYAIAIGSQFPTITKVTELLANTTYHAALFEYNGQNFPVYNPEPVRLTFTTLTYATEGSTALEARNVGAERVQLQRFRGTGSGRIIVARPAGNPPGLPVDGTDYPANATYGQGGDLGNGSFVVDEEIFYLPDNRAITGELGGLEANTTYVFTNYETTSDGTNTYYRLPGEELTLTTSAEPTVAPVGLQINDVLNESATVAWTTGNGEGEVVLLREGGSVGSLVETGREVFPSSTFNPNFSNIVGNAQPVFFGPQTEVNLTQLRSGTQYFVSVQAYNGWRKSPAYQQVGVIDSFVTLGKPAIQARELLVTEERPDRISLRWTKGGGTGRILVAKQGAPVDAFPVDGFTYTPNTFFGSGEDLGNDNYVIATGDLDTISVTDLTVGATYHFAVFEYNDDQSILYNTQDSATAVGVAQLTLPVTWRYFRGEAVKRDARLEWATSSEVNAARFVVERSRGGEAFTPVGRVPAAGAGTYSFTDADLAPGRYVYRLRQEDLDGAFAYSSVVPLTVEAEHELAVYPNPVGDRFRILGAAASARFRLRSVAGGIVRRGEVSARGVETGSLPPGTYVLEVGERRVLVVKR